VAYLQVSHQAVAVGGRHKVRNEEPVREEPLREQHRGAHDDAGLLELQKRQQVQALVLRLEEAKG